MTDERQTGAKAAHLVEDYIRQWLRRSEMGRGVLANHTPEDAMKYIWELLNVFVRTAHQIKRAKAAVKASGANVVELGDKMETT